MYEQIFGFIHYGGVPIKKHDCDLHCIEFDIESVPEDFLKDFSIEIKKFPGQWYDLYSEGNGVLLKELLKVDDYAFCYINPEEGYIKNKKQYIKFGTFKKMFGYMRFSKIKNKTKKIEELRELIKKHNLNIEITQYKKGYRADIITIDTLEVE